MHADAPTGEQVVIAVGAPNKSVAILLFPRVTPRERDTRPKGGARQKPWLHEKESLSYIVHCL